MLLAALHTVADRTSYRMLSLLLRGDVASNELAAASGLGSFAAGERVSQLAAAGLVGRDPQSGRVHATPLAHGLVGLVERVRRRFAAKIEERLAGLLEERR
jgi:hypothetical protein